MQEAAKEMSQPLFSLWMNALWPFGWINSLKARLFFRRLQKDPDLEKSGTQCMVEVETRRLSHTTIEKILQKVGEKYGWTWRFADPKNPDEEQVIRHERADLSQYLHEIGARGRRAYNRKHRHISSAYYTGKKQ